MASSRLTFLLLLTLVSSGVTAAAQVPACVLVDPEDGTPESAGVIPPRYQRGPGPRYPNTATAHLEGGRVELIFVVDCDGKVDAASIVVRSATDSAFIPPAIAAMTETIFRPATSRGRKVAMRIVQRVNFAPYIYNDARGVPVPGEQVEGVPPRAAADCPPVTVDSALAARPGFMPASYITGPPPKYPRELRQRAVPGRVRLRFVVRCNGRVERASIVVLDATDDAFAAPAIEAIAETRFVAATLDGRKVAQVMDLALRFELQSGRPSLAPEWWVPQTRRP